MKRYLSRGFFWVIILFASYSTVACDTFTTTTTQPNYNVEIDLNGLKNITIDYGEYYSEAGAIATDQDGHSVAVVISGVVNTQRVGYYQIVYTATYRGESYVEVREVTVIEPTLSADEIFVLKTLLALKDGLKNPDSLVFYGAMSVSASSGKKMTAVRVSAMNSFGGQINSTFIGVEGYDSLVQIWSSEYNISIIESVENISSSSYNNSYDIDAITYFLNEDKLP